jgi:hypothetical protein
MTDTTKSFLKRTILGLVGGGAVSALYAMHSSKKDKESDPESVKDEIVVPLSRRNFLKAVRPERLSGKAMDRKMEEHVPVMSDEDIAGMSPRDLASLKKALIRKKAECSKGDKCGKVSKVVTTSSGTAPVRHVAGAGSTFRRDEKGRFASDGSCKSAGFLDDAGEVMANNLGLIGGTAAGMVAMKMVSDRILINRRKRQVENARKMYADAIANEVNDEDAPYYRKTAGDHGMFGSTLGYLGLAGLTAGTAAAAVMYRIMENRRKEEEKAKDKDLSKYPVEKSIRFRFPDAGEDRFFG